MKQVLYKKEYKTYSNTKYKDSTPIGYIQKYVESDENIFGFNEARVDRPTRKHPHFSYELTDNTEQTFSDNFANPIWSIQKSYFMVVVEKDGDKVSIKTFHGWKHRRAGVQWFKVSKSMDFISVNVKTGDVYVGGIQNYHLKRKCKKHIRRNYFLGQPLYNMMSMIKNNIKGEGNETASFDAISTFMNEIDPNDSFGDLNFSQRLFKFYLNKRNIKFPNNFYVFMDYWFGPEIRKILKKNDNKMVDSVMERYKLSGKQLKKALHNCENLNINAYETARNIFGDDWLNQDEDLILACLNFKSGLSQPNEEFLNYASNEELKRVFKIFKEVVVNQTLDSYTFFDHIRMYTELKQFGETDLRWMSSVDSKAKFREEHLDWSDKLDHYRKGDYTRIYPEYSYDFIQKPISVGDHTYYPLLLNNSDSYNKESAQQSNCVKTYIGKCSSIIVSVRKGNVDSDERATIEYQLKKLSSNKIEIKRIQSLGRFNKGLSEEWDDVLFKLDELMLYYIEDEKFDTVKIKKVCKNGVELESDSHWNTNGYLKWTQERIKQSDTNYFFEGLW
jgi:hypothetical protein